MLRKRSFSSAVTALLLLASWAVPTQAQSLKEAVRLATERDPLITALQHAVARGTTNIEIAKDGKRPQVSIGGATATNDDDPALSVTISQVLIDWGLVKAQVAAASHERVKTVAQMKMAVEDLSLQVAELYIELETLDRKVQRTQGYIDFAKRIEGFSRSRVAAGLSDSAEIARARLEIARAEEHMMQLQSDRSITLSQLEFLLGRPVSTPSIAPNLAFAERFASSAKVIEAVMLAPAYIEARADRDIAAEGIKAAKASKKPKIVLQAEGRQDLTGGRGRSGAIGLSAGVDLNGTSFSGRAVLAAEQDKAAAESRLLAAERELQNAVRIFAQQIKILEANEAAQQRQLAQAEEVLSAYEQQFVAGRRELIDLLTTSRDLYDAEIDEIETYKERKVTEYAAAHSVGMLGSLLFATR
ncbi:TolC family protein [Xinfangfangia sp. CPCC 101601]|uniref:TolC family protein n=1 Tax=Pseudogemmobacter lacusdianii TaxID=3069608 RepID=A0ABU0VUH7_9RHOB|nr:TolC family protein [Xinfangfangia sp. CPCC 101601]MDQ2065358.1 TolC family protein [Xinfangfangia sp. CPCC 101601]